MATNSTHSEPAPSNPTENTAPSLTEEPIRTTRGKCNNCGTEYKSKIEKAIHCIEAHDRGQERYFDLDPGQFFDLLRQCNTIPELSEELGWSTPRVLRLIGGYGLEDWLLDKHSPEPEQASKSHLLTTNAPSTTPKLDDVEK